MSNKYKDYTRYSDKPAYERTINDDKQEIFGASTSVAEPEPITNEPTPEEPTPVIDTVTATEGFVTGCKKLNVREHPDTKANVVCVLDEGTVVEVFQSESVGDYYKVCTEIGIEGYCVKTYIGLA